MKIVFTKCEDYTKVTVTDATDMERVYTFDDYKEAKAFFQGFSCARMMANSLIQSMPMDYSEVKA